LLRKRPASRPIVKSSRPKVFTVMVVSSHGRTLTISVSRRMIVALGCALILIAGTCLFSSTGYAFALRRITELRYLEGFRDNVRTQLTDLQQELVTLRRELDDAQEEVGRVREVLRSEGIFEPVSSSQEDTWRAAESSISLSRGGSRRSAPSPEEMLRTVKELQEESDALLKLVAGLKEDALLVSAEASARQKWHTGGRCRVRIQLKRISLLPLGGGITRLRGFALFTADSILGLRSVRLSARQPTEWSRLPGGMAAMASGSSSITDTELRLFTVIVPSWRQRSVRRSYAATSSPALATPE